MMSLPITLTREYHVDKQYVTLNDGVLFANIVQLAISSCPFVRKTEAV